MLIKFVGSSRVIFVEADSFEMDYNYVTTIQDAAQTLRPGEQMHVVAGMGESAPETLDRGREVFRRVSLYRPGRRETVLFNTNGYVLNDKGDTLDRLEGLERWSLWEPDPHGDLVRAMRICDKCEHPFPLTSKSGYVCKSCERCVEAEKGGKLC
jgi:hypothetical protein